MGNSGQFFWPLFGAVVWATVVVCQKLHQYACSGGMLAAVLGPPTAGEADADLLGCPYAGIAGLLCDAFWFSLCSNQM